MTAHPIGTVTDDGRITCDLCTTWATSERLDPVGALTQHRATRHPGARPAAPEPTRHPAGIVLGALILAVFGLPAAAAWVAGGWWLAAAGPLTLVAAFGAFGISRDATRAPRDARGNRLR
ncbi:hypothetical protein ACOQFV_27410 [Nocardiopsis changdeensis]|uniref:C2H2-type domain-containing protein n=1 Tax=Nocardiopsis changdeensis TaxID=2831969 RepID=A0ABX8BL91_9ACTN|nr:MULTISPECIES: hypothetical protein [Nocardiopsis]QUX22997.1 hypothetical protein KGD84_00870 [Nocardiopsis changdeensis]QYX38940.1 hypothetical protein K1J57_10320 [Nocardiopsis sp. MT53]